MANYENLEVWKKAMLLVKAIYLQTKKYPKEELFTLTSQTKRAAVSVPANIAEGLGRQYKKDTIQFLHIARGSIYELQTHLHIAIMTNIVVEEECLATINLSDIVLKLLNGFINSIEKRADLK